jgi:hypothetical protein
MSMNQYKAPPPEGKDPVLWEIARRRASFRSHLLTYMVMNAFFWAVCPGRYGLRWDGASGWRFIISAPMLRLKKIR